MAYQKRRRFPHHGHGEVHPKVRAVDVRVRRGQVEGLLARVFHAEENLAGLRKKPVERQEGLLVREPHRDICRVWSKHECIHVPGAEVDGLHPSAVDNAGHGGVEGGNRHDVFAGSENRSGTDSLPHYILGCSVGPAALRLELPTPCRLADGRWAPAERLCLQGLAVPVLAREDGSRTCCGGDVEAERHRKAVALLVPSQDGVAAGGRHRYGSGGDALARGVGGSVQVAAARVERVRDRRGEEATVITPLFLGPARTGCGREVLGLDVDHVLTKVGNNLRYISLDRGFCSDEATGRQHEGQHHRHHRASIVRSAGLTHVLDTHPRRPCSDPAGSKVRLPLAQHFLIPRPPLA